MAPCTFRLGGYEGRHDAAQTGTAKEPGSNGLPGFYMGINPPHTGTVKSLRFKALCREFVAQVGRRTPSFTGWFPIELGLQGTRQPGTDCLLRPHSVFSQAQRRWKLAGFDEFFEGSVRNAQALHDFGFEQYFWGGSRHVDLSLLDYRVGLAFSLLRCGERKPI